MRLLPLLALTFATTTAAAPSDWQERDRGPGIAAVRQDDALSWPAGEFDSVAYGLPGDVEVRVGPSWSVRATGPAAAFANVRVERRDDRLVIGHRYDGRDTDPAVERQAHFVVTLPRLAAVALGGSGRMDVDRVRGDALTAAVGGSGRLTLGSLEVERATVSIGGSGGVTARGNAGRLTASIGGSGSLDAPGLTAASARVSVAGSGSVRASVAGPATVSTVGSGSVDLGPRARCSVSRMGHSEVRCG